MKIIITGRHMEISPSLKDYAEKKLQKFEKYFHQLMDIHVVMSVEKLDHMIDLLINGDGIQFYAVEKSGDMYSSIDLIADKMEKQIVRFKEKQSGHKVVPLRMIDTVEMGEREGFELSFEQVSNKPKTEIEAYLEMKLVGSDFLLFKKGSPVVENGFDYANRNYAVLFRSKKGLKIVEIPLEMIQSGVYEPQKFLERDMVVVQDSNTDPKVKFKKSSKCREIDNYNLSQALKKIIENQAEFLPFFNTDTRYLNIMFRNGKQYGVMVPAF